MKICAISATCGRHKLMERSIRLFLNQNYQGIHELLIYNNSPVQQKLGNFSTEAPNKLVTLINQSNSNITNQPYDNLGDIYNDALRYVSPDTDIIIHWDDDDLFLPDHITEGVQGLKKAISLGKEAYKPSHSYYRHGGGIQLMSNTLEPSIFVTARHIKQHGYSRTTSDQHLQWVNPLVYEQKILVSEVGLATLIYNWGDTDIPTFKTSGNATHPDNFKNYRSFSRDHGDQVLTPWKKEEVQKYYDLVYAK